MTEGGTSPWCRQDGAERSEAEGVIPPTLRATPLKALRALKGVRTPSVCCADSSLKEGAAVGKRHSEPKGGIPKYIVLRAKKRDQASPV